MNSIDVLSMGPGDLALTAPMALQLLKEAETVYCADRFAFLVPFVLLMAGWRFTATLGESDGEPLRNRLLQLGIMLAAAGGICFGIMAFPNLNILVKSILGMGLALLFYCIVIIPEIKMLKRF